VRPADPARVVTAARGWLGTPYHDQASIKSVGCDCLGLARGVWREVVGEEPLPVPPYSRDWGEIGRVEVLHEAAARVMLPADLALLEPGMLLLFRMYRGAIAKHCGIVTGPGTFIHAYERLGVIEEPLTEAWRRRVAFAFLFPRANAGAEQRSETKCKEPHAMLPPAACSSCASSIIYGAESATEDSRFLAVHLRTRSAQEGRGRNAASLLDSA
jgi:NlpC/P60 family putative phage cell wall peptidase